MEKPTLLPFLTAKQAAEQARTHVIEERKGEQYGLFTPFEGLNIAMGKFARFNNVNLWAGLSGHGKSYLLNKLNKGFLSYKPGEINSGINFVPIVFQFSLEMSAYNEVLRDVAGAMGVSYGYLLSSQYDKKTKTYNKLTDAELETVNKYLDDYATNSILYFEVAGNLKMIYATVMYYARYYTALGKKNGITYKFIVNIDHTLLIDMLDERDNLTLMANVGKMAIAFRKEIFAMVNLLGQLNNNIEDVRRLTTPALHYPQKSDIYAQGQLFNACDNVYVIHQPQLLGILEYGRYRRETKDLMHLLKLKARHGDVGSIWLTNNLKEGKIEELIKINADEKIENGHEDYQDENLHEI